MEKDLHQKPNLTPKQEALLQPLLKMSKEERRQVAKDLAEYQRRHETDLASLKQDSGMNSQGPTSRRENSPLMNYGTFIAEKDKARAVLGPNGTLICHISAGDLEELSKDVHNVLNGEGYVDETSGLLSELHPDVIFWVRRVHHTFFTLQGIEDVYTDI